MSIWVRNKKGRLEIFETYFGNLFDTPSPSPSPSSSITGDETHNNHEENRRTMYELLHPTQIMFLHASCFHLMHTTCRTETMFISSTS